MILLMDILHILIYQMEFSFIVYEVYSIMLLNKDKNKIYSNVDNDNNEFQGLQLLVHSEYIEVSYLWYIYYLLLTKLILVYMTIYDL